MKHYEKLTFFTLIVCIGMVISCSKPDSQVKPNFSEPNSNSDSSTITPVFKKAFDANNWQKAPAGYFICRIPVTFPYSIDNIYNFEVKIYLFEDNRKVIPINDRTFYNGGIIWAEYGQTFVTILFFDGSISDVENLPFSSSKILVEVFDY